MAGEGPSGKLWEQRRPENSRQPRLMRCFGAGSQRGDKYLKGCEDNCERDAGAEATFPGNGITYILIDMKKTVLETQTFIRQEECTSTTPFWSSSPSVFCCKPIIKTTLLQRKRTTSNTRELWEASRQRM